MILYISASRDPLESNKSPAWQLERDHGNPPKVLQEGQELLKSPSVRLTQGKS